MTDKKKRFFEELEKLFEKYNANIYANFDSLYCWFSHDPHFSTDYQINSDAQLVSKDITS